MNYPEPVRHAITQLASETSTAEDQIEVESIERTECAGQQCRLP